MKPKLETLLKFGRYLRQRRLDDGAVELESLEVHFQLDKSKKRALDVVLEEDMEVHHTVAELMVHANRCVALRNQVADDNPFNFIFYYFF